MRWRRLKPDLTGPTRLLPFRAGSWVDIGLSCIMAAFKRVGWS
jgi:hypothetical protein